MTIGFSSWFTRVLQISLQILGHISGFSWTNAQKIRKISSISLLSSFEFQGNIFSFVQE